MSTGNELGNLKTGEWDQLQDVANRLEEAWKADSNADLNKFLPPPGEPLRLVILQELVKTDMECRWRRRLDVELEYYVARFPELAQIMTPQLVFEEYRIRQRIGDHPGLDQYKDRFPQFFESLQRLAMEMSVPTKQEPTGSAGTAVSGKSPGALIEIGGYKFIERIGAGGFGEVWKAEAPGGFLKAIKSIFRPIDHIEAQRELESLELIKQTHHHFLLSTHSYWAEKDRLYILMDLADGSLRDRLNECLNKKKAALPLLEALKYIRQSAEALDYLHSKGIQHRDIKPENILLIEGNVRVADFGLARPQRTRRLVSGTGSGTPLYMPPEVWNDKIHNNSDQYSLAITYFELRAGRRLYSSQGLASLMQDHLLHTPNLEPLEEDEKQVLLRALAKQPEDRYATCMEFVHELEQALGPQIANEAPLDGSSPISFRPLTNVDTDMMTIGTAKGKKSSAPDTERDLVVPGWKSKSAPVAPPPARRSLAWPMMVVACLAVGLAVWLMVNRGPSGFDLVPPESMPVFRAGQTDKFAIVIERRNFEEPIVVSFVTDPDIHIENQTFEGARKAADIKVIIDDKAAEGTRKIQITAKAGETERTATLEVKIAPPNTLPPPCPAGYFQQAGNADLVDVGGRKYYERIECVLPDKTTIRFVLVPWEGAGRGSFYIMEDKVWNELFARFAAKNPKAVVNSRWTLGARVNIPQQPWGNDEFTLNVLAIANIMANAPNMISPLAIVYEEHSLFLPHPGDLGVRKGKLPVLRVSIQEAHLCARWLGGLLPTADQWDKAAGKFEIEPGEGPFKTPWNPGEIAVNRKFLGPLNVGEASKDESPLHCRDMAGNGLEWTRNIVQVSPIEFVDIDQKIPVTAGVQLRGRNYRHPRPLKFADTPLSIDFWESGRTQDWDSHIIGFRVVLVIDQNKGPA